MAGPDQAQLLVRAGTAEPANMALPRGTAIGPLSVGRTGTWRVVAPGVLEEHAFIYFNGTELFLQSANPNSPVTVNGSPIPSTWTPVYAPCEINFGGARLFFGTPAQAAQSRPPPARSVPPPARSAPPPAPPSPQPAERKPFMPRVNANAETEEESTRLHPLEEIQAMRRPVAMGPQAAPNPGAFQAPAPGASRDAVGATLKSPGSVAPSAAAPSFGAPPSAAAPSFGAPPSAAAPSFGAPPQQPSTFAPPTMLGAPPQQAPSFGAPPAPGSPMMPPGTAPPVVPPKKESWIGARWREASGPKKALMLLLLPLIWAVFVIFTDKPPAAKPTKPATSASTSPSSTPSAGSASATPSVAPVPPPPPPPPPSPTPSGKASAAPSASPVTTSKTPQREAADAVAVGAYDKAARLYDELAKAHPEVPAYAEAARIMKAKAGKR